MAKREFSVCDAVVRRRQGRGIVVRALLTAAVASAGAAQADCSCQCVEGVARTTCTSVDEARGNPNECGVGSTVACAAPPALEVPSEQYAAPTGAADCHSRRVWDPQTNAYSIVAKVCNLAPVDVGW